MGTLRFDLMCGCRLSSEKGLRKAGRGSYDAAVDLNSGVSLVRWYGEYL